jgi:hypothetical protein
MLMRKGKFICDARTGSFLKIFPAALCFLGFALAFSPAARAQTELGSVGDLTALGVDGTALDPDTKIKGFTVFGSTQAAYTGAIVGRGNVVVNGVLSVSSGAYFAGNSTFTAAGNIFVNDGAAGQMLGKNSGGWLQWLEGDNLGNHIATQVLNMGGYTDDGYVVDTSSAISAAAFQINGSTVLANIPGTNSLSVGIGAGRVSEGYYCFFLGPFAGYNSTGVENNFVGSYAGYTNTLGLDNAFLGSYAGYANISGAGNTFLGAGAGEDNTFGTGNSFVGANAGYSNLGTTVNTGSTNTFVGAGAGYSNILDIRSVFVGAGAGYKSSTGNRQSFVGADAGYSDNDGQWNSHFGSAAGKANITGNLNTCFGANAGLKTTGGESAFLGFAAGYSNTTPSNNTFAGAYAGYSTVTHDDTVYFGAGAGYYNNGADNAVFGYNAGRGTSGSSVFSSSTLAGYQAGYSLTTGRQNVFLGYQAGYNVTTGTGNIIIGYNQNASAAGAINEINIGGVYKGDTFTGRATIPKFTVQAADSGITLTSADFGKTITVNSASAQIVYLPAVTAADIGATVTVIKYGAGQVTVDAASSSYIVNSTSGGTIYNNATAPPLAQITIRLVTSTLWMIISYYGTWTVT